MDVDGVLTDGRLFHFVEASGRLVELKGLDSQDGLALAWLASRGIKTGIISGRSSEGVEARARMLKMSFIVQGTVEKLPAFEGILRSAGLEARETAFIGDDLPDIPVMRAAGWAVAVRNARPEVRRAAHTVTRARGGRGAVREVAQALLRAQGHWGQITRLYAGY